MLSLYSQEQVVRPLTAYRGAASGSTGTGLTRVRGVPFAGEALGFGDLSVLLIEVSHNDG
jgi:hypothetical protein